MQQTACNANTKLGHALAIKNATIKKPPAQFFEREVFLLEEVANYCSFKLALKRHITIVIKTIGTAAESFIGGWKIFGLKRIVVVVHF
jgi:hypothetical protein